MNLDCDCDMCMGASAMGTPAMETLAIGTPAMGASNCA